MNLHALEILVELGLSISMPVWIIIATLVAASALEKGHIPVKWASIWWIGIIIMLISILWRVWA